MRLSSDQLSKLESLAALAAERAGAMVQSEVGKHRDVIQKDGGSSLASQVVTEVDFESQRLILESLAGSIETYHLGLLTEERADDASRHQRDYFWCIDPLDGTLPFIEGSPGYSVSIALVSQAGVPVIGVVYDPVTGTLYQANRGSGARRNGKPWTIEPNDRKNALTLVMDRSFARQPNYPELLKKIEGVATAAGMNGLKTIGHGGAAMNACWVIEHAPAIYFKLPKPQAGGGSLWDYAATVCLFAELGLEATDIHGAPLQLNRRESTFMNHDGIIFASDPPLAEAVRSFHA